ncbi:alpha/beta hydrolase [Chitinophaga varians]|uniref:alpha/beta hydrolase n=1 Tax=Chitinophaga varians TaxID=2202339 RepID=UPI00165EE58A|nr:alpha/beta hydrolase [Chitinophaga varians]MBC9911728.1 alpha/beta hydrolase [Chitinophaga varians]
MFEHLDIMINGRRMQVVAAGKKSTNAILFLHGYPQSWSAFEAVMQLLSADYYVLAVDLPGIGDSADIGNYSKKAIAAHIAAVITSLGLSRVVVAGHDIGGMITFSLLRHFPHLLSAAVIMSTAVPGVMPWEEVKRNPYIWHFAFFAVPHLPEAMIAGHESPLCHYFYDTLAYNKAAITPEKRQQYVDLYRKASALNTSLGWYRAFSEDEKELAPVHPVAVPVLYLRGHKEPGEFSSYIEGLRKSGCQEVTGAIIDDSGHFTPEENPAGVAHAIHLFLTDRQII